MLVLYFFSVFFSFCMELACNWCQTKQNANPLFIISRIQILTVGDNNATDAVDDSSVKVGNVLNWKKEEDAVTNHLIEMLIFNFTISVMSPLFNQTFMLKCLMEIVK